MLIVTSKYCWQTKVVLTIANLPKKSQVGNEQKNRSLRHGNARAQKVVLLIEYARYVAVGIRKEKGLIKHEGT